MGQCDEDRDIPGVEVRVSMIDELAETAVRLAATWAVEGNGAMIATRPHAVIVKVP